VSQEELVDDCNGSEAQAGLVEGGQMDY